MPMGMPMQGGYFPTKRKRSPLGCLFLCVLLIGPAIGIGFAIWGVLKARDAINQVEDLSDPGLSSGELSALGLGPEIETLFDPGAAPAVVAAFEDRIGGNPTRFTQLLFYTDYSFADAQDPTQPTHIDEYPWRAAKVGSPSPQSNVDDLESKLFSSSDVNWSAIAPVVSQAATLTNVEQGTISHMMVTRPNGAVEVFVYVSGPRSSGYLQLDANANVIAVH